MYTNYKTKTAAAKAAAHHNEHYAAQSAAWTGLCEAYLPRVDSSIWRFSAAGPSRAQGWKLHVAATIFTAVEVLERIGPLLKEHEVPFKAPATLDELFKLNAGTFYGYHQVGKFLTIYPRTDLEARKLAAELHQLTRDIVAPTIPFDQPYLSDSRVYYRYGAFVEQKVESEGKIKLAIQDPDGKLIPDRRDVASPPEWVQDPFGNIGQTPDQPKTPTLLTTRFKAFRALAQRGKGGVYLAVDLSTAPPRPCVLKEGRRHGEVGIDGRDGFWRIQHEAHALRSLARKGLAVQSIYAGFKAEKNYFLALEYIHGETLQAYLERRQRRLSIKSVLRKSIAIASVLADIHRVGWVWRDCKPQNLIITKNGSLRAIDFEGACTIANPDPFQWGTRPYSPPEAEELFRGQCRLPEDLYALGNIMFLLFAGRPREVDTEAIQDVRKGVPSGVCEIVSALLHKDPRYRPSAKMVTARLSEELNQLM